MALDPQVTGGAGNTDPTPGVGGGAPPGGTQAPAPAASAAPAARTYSDADMAAARRSFEAQSRREREAALTAVRAEYEQRFAPKPQANDPWSALSPDVAQALKQIFDHEWNSRSTPILRSQEDISFRNEEAEIRAKYQDYGQNRSAVLEYAVQHGIADVEQAYRAWKFDEFSKLDPDAIGKAAVAAHIKKVASRSAQTPAVEGKGGGAVPVKQQFKDRDAMDEAAKEMFRAAQESSA